MTTVLTDTNIDELLKVAAGDREALRKLTENLEKRVEERFKDPKASQGVKPKAEGQNASSATAG
jgi:hypothetical protein